MAYGSIIQPATVDTSGLTVSTEAATAGSASITAGETTGTASIPAGSRYVKIRVAGFVQTGDQEVDATINSTTWSVGRVAEFRAGFDRQNNEELLLPAFSINGNGGRVFYEYY